eukprot:TRINITY_DN48335_c0_g1_i1.p1 TRINITY_DN48335_c0_g1~~TRINITY_DN48335_c0_g1_i1.p1  ORF type:complete len:504 (-),score=101.04 TRINITY_DN48335_c0_g1_i1:150-1661(-)
MGVTCPSLSNLVVIDAAGLQKILEQIFSELAAQAIRVKGVEKKIHDEFGEDYVQHSEAAAAKKATERAQIDAQLQKLEQRQLKAAEERAGLLRQCQDAVALCDRFSRELDGEVRARQEQGVTLESQVKELQARQSELEEGACKAREEVSREFVQQSKMLEARVRVAETKASECHREAKGYRNHDEEHDAALSRVERKLSTVEGQAKLAFDGSVEAQAGVILNGPEHIAEKFKANLRDLEKDIRSKASAATMDAMRRDLEQTQRIARDAIEALVRKVNDQEERLTASSNRETVRRVAVSQEDADTSSAQKSGCSHCLVCGSSPCSPSREMQVEGVDGQMYGHSDMGNESTESFNFKVGGGNTAASSRLGGGLVVRPSMTSPSIPRSSTAPQIVCSTLGCGGNGAAAATAGAAPRLPRCGGNLRKESRSSVCSALKRGSSDTELLTEGASPHWASSASSTRPSSAGASRPPSRPASAGAARKGSRPLSAQSDLRDSLPINSYLAA